MGLNEYLRILRRQKWVIILTTLVTSVVMLVGLTGIQTQYTAQGTLVVDTVPVGGVDFLSFDVDYSDRLMNTYTDAFRSSYIMNTVMDELGLEKAPEVKIDVIESTEILLITATADNAYTAPEFVNALIRLIVEQPEELIREWRSRLPAGLTPPIGLEELQQISLLELAPEIGEAVGVNKTSLMILGVLVGLTGAIGLAFVLNNLDTRIYSIEQLGKVSNLPVIADIPHKKRRIDAIKMSEIPVYAEAFQRVQASIVRGDNKVILITSAAQTVGKSTLTANLGLIFAKSGRKTVIIDTDQYKPTQHKLFSISNNIGISKVLQDRSLEKNIQTLKNSRLSIITNGPPAPDLNTLLGGPVMSGLLLKLREKYDVILIDTPPYPIASNAKSMLQMVDAVLLVARAGQSKEEIVRETTQELRDLKANVLGTVFTGTTIRRSYQRYLKERK